MATRVPSAGLRQVRRSPDDRFFLISAIAMTVVIFAGFVMQLALGRSSFAVGPLYHLHAVVFMGWISIYLVQTWLGTVGAIGLHRMLGWVAVAWMMPMIVLGPAITVDRVQAGRVPFFFQPQHFLIANPMTILAFVALSGAAVVLRRRTDWHRRLHLCGMAALLGPGFGRLMPMPLMEPVAFQSAAVVGLAFPIAGVIAERRRGRGVHPAWLWGIGALVAMLVLTEVIARSVIGDAIYRGVTAGTPGAAVAPMAFASPPGPLPSAP